MRLARIELFVAAFALILACAPAVRSEDRTGSRGLELKLARRPQSVSVLLDPEIVRTDTERVISHLELQEWVEGVIRKTIESRRRRPDLTYDVLSGIQARSLTDALR